MHFSRQSFECASPWYLFTPVTGQGPLITNYTKKMKNHLCLLYFILRHQALLHMTIAFAIVGFVGYLSYLYDQTDPNPAVRHSLFLYTMVLLAGTLLDFLYTHTFQSRRTCRLRFLHYTVLCLTGNVIGIFPKPARKTVDEEGEKLERQTGFWCSFFC